MWEGNRDDMRDGACADMRGGRCEDMRGGRDDGSGANCMEYSGGSYRSPASRHGRDCCG